MDQKEFIDKDKLAAAKERYLKYEPVAVIAKDMGIARTSLQNWVNREWKAERELARAELFEDVAKVKKVQFVKLTENAITVLSRALETLAKSQDNITMKEARDVAAIMESLDKITRLDENKPTEIHSQEKVVTVVELREKLRVDPFLVLDVEKGEYSVTEN
jgi:hypothetical protein